MRLAGTYHPISYLLNKIPLYIPGIEEVNAIWCDKSKQLKSTFSNLPAEGDNKIMFQRWRNQSFRSIWLSSFDPFQPGPSQSVQMSLDDENDLDTLVLSFDSIYDKHKDILAITFPKKLFLKNFNVSFAGISSQEKLVLSNLLSSILHTEYTQCIDEQKFLTQLSNHSRYNQEKAAQLEEQLKASEALYSSAINSILTELLEEYAKDWNTVFMMDQELVKYFAREKLSLGTIKSQVEEMVTIAYHLNSSSKEIVLDSSYIHALQTNGIIDHSNRASTENEDKIIQLLNRYERAATKIENNNGTLNAKEIAKQLEPPVTPPAITDAVKKNRRKISYFLKQYPNRWRLVRSVIRPIQKLDTDNLSRTYRVSS